MHFTILDTDSAYRRLLDAPDAAARARIFADELAQPFAGLARVFGSSDPVQAFASWNMSAEQFAPERRAVMQERLDRLTAADAFNRAAGALERGWAAFEDYHDRIRLESITFGLMLADMSTTPQAGGYTGFGGVPGWIMTVYDMPTPYNLKRLEAATVHELHHNLAGASDSAVNFNMMTTTVGDYMIMEGLAESFSAELYGEDRIGPWVTGFDETKLEETRAKFRDALALTGFGVIRSYIFGDEITSAQGREPVGVPLYAGYALGYKVVQAFLARTGKTVVQATYVPAAEIIAGSGFFDS